jgi:hypothetical protein
MKKVISIVLCTALLALCSCSQKADSEEAEFKEVGISKFIKSVDEKEFVKLITLHDSCLIFITAGWCGGGALHLKNNVLPNYNEITNSGMPVIVSFLGDVKGLNLNPDSLQSLTDFEIYKVETNVDIAFFHKRKMKNILEEVDPTIKFQSKVPQQLKYANKKLGYLKKNFDELDYPR